MRRSRAQATPQTALSNIDTVARLESEFLERRTLAERIGDKVGDFVGSMAFVTIHALWFAVWFTWNSGAIPGLKAFDPYPFVFLTMAVSSESVLLSTFVLMKQNRMSRRADQRDHLNLQISLLAEKEITKVIQMLSEMSRHQGLHLVDKEVEELSQNTAVERLAPELRHKLPEKPNYWSGRMASRRFWSRRVMGDCLRISSRSFRSFRKRPK
jgi:uncharacterized membrane protein